MGVGVGAELGGGVEEKVVHCCEQGGGGGGEGGEEKCSDHFWGGGVERGWGWGKEGGCSWFWDEWFGDLVGGFFVREDECIVAGGSCCLVLDERESCAGTKTRFFFWKELTETLS